jgi:8-oxo-dGTP pyrophosphatase MutT (NUDIX family)
MAIDSVSRSRLLRPRDSATIIIVRRDGPMPRVLMGKRHAGHAFMPNKYVFPGGRVDAADCRLGAARDLHPKVAEKLLARMRGQPSLARARGLAMAAVRETFEEVGMIVGLRHDGAARSRSAPWRAFLETGYSPDLAGLRLFARAITPPGRPRRFDSRFFVLDAENVANRDHPLRTASNELLDPYWVTFGETRDLDLPSITRDVLKRLERALENEDALAPGAPLSFQYFRHGKWWAETL